MIDEYVGWRGKLTYGPELHAVYMDTFAFVNFRVETADTCLLLIRNGRVADALGIRFSRPLPDLPAFCDELFSSRAPFRLWGQPAVTEDEALVEAVDLHVGHRIGIELGRDWMRVYLHAGSCGNTVARLISNLQTRFDGALSLTHPDLQAAAGLNSRTALAL